MKTTSPGNPMATAASAQSKLEGKASIGQRIGGKVSYWQVNLSGDCQSMMYLHKGWMDRLLGFTFFSSRVTQKILNLFKNGLIDGLSLLGQKVLKNLYFL